MTRTRRTATALFLLAAIAGTACGVNPPGSTTPDTTAPTTAPTTTTTPPAQSACAATTSPPVHYDHVIVFAFENRTWSTVGGPGFAGMPYLHSLATDCASFSEWLESDDTQNSGTQYVSQMQGDLNHTVRNDCTPSSTCESVADNLFRQARAANLTAVNYVEGATTGCSAAGNAAKHIPALYFHGADDAAHCNEQVRPYTEFDVNNLPDFAFVTPTLCNDGHDCPNATVDQWASSNLGAVLQSSTYQQGRTLVEVWYDEDRPVPNLYIAPTAHHGQVTATVGYDSTLRLWETALGLGCLGAACTATDLRPLAGI